MGQSTVMHSGPIYLFKLKIMITNSERIQSAPSFTDEFREGCNSECSSYRLRFCYNNKVCYISNIALIARDYICQNKLVLVFNSSEDMESALEECAILDYDNNSIIELIPGVRMGIAFRIKLPVGTSIGIESVC